MHRERQRRGIAHHEAFDQEQGSLWLRAQRGKGYAVQRAIGDHQQPRFALPLPEQGRQQRARASSLPGPRRQRVSRCPPRWRPRCAATSRGRARRAWRSSARVSNHAWLASLPTKYASTAPSCGISACVADNDGSSSAHVGEAGLRGALLQPVRHRCAPASLRSPAAAARSRQGQRSPAACGFRAAAAAPSAARAGRRRPDRRLTARADTRFASCSASERARTASEVRSAFHIASRGGLPASSAAIRASYGE